MADMLATAGDLRDLLGEDDDTLPDEQAELLLELATGEVQAATGVLPADAGMIRRPSSPRPRAPGAPRGRGDDPVMAWIEEDAALIDGTSVNQIFLAADREMAAFDNAADEN